MVDCYSCKINPALDGELFPFCSEECKEKWNENRPKPKIVGSKRSIEEIQHIIMTQWKPNAPKSVLTKEEYEVKQAKLNI